MALKNRLKALRQSAGLTQEQLADATGLRQVHISRLERGIIGKPRYDTVMRLAKALQVSPEQVGATFKNGDV